MNYSGFAKARAVVTHAPHLELNPDRILLRYIAGWFCHVPIDSDIDRHIIERVLLGIGNGTDHIHRTSGNGYPISNRHDASSIRGNHIAVMPAQIA